HDDRWWAVPVQTTGATRLHIIDTSNGQNAVIVEAPSIFHPELLPDHDLVYLKRIE
ncbi:MAG: hypothetical protein GYB66_02470, partial [Chloroflexi bacterium]|nr:hypothetical protein [Chloroflexota bacterium]